MTDEAMAEEYANENKRIYGSDEYADITDYNNVKEAFLAGLKAGKEAEKEYVKNNAFTSMKEQGVFPFDKWHKVADGDLPKDEDYKLCVSSNGAYYIARYEELFVSWTNQEHKEVCCPYAWKEIVSPKEIKK